MLFAVAEKERLRVRDAARDRVDWKSLPLGAKAWRKKSTTSPPRA